MLVHPHEPTKQQLVWGKIVKASLTLATSVWVEDAATISPRTMIASVRLLRERSFMLVSRERWLSLFDGSRVVVSFVRLLENPAPPLLVSLKPVECKASLWITSLANLEG